MSVEEVNKTCIRRIVDEVFNKGNMEVVPELIAPDWVIHSPFGEYRGPEGFKQYITGTRNAFPDFHMTIDDMVAEGDKLAARVSWRATFKGKFGDIEPTGKQINMTAAYFYRMADGKEVEVLPYLDSLALFQQLGVSPPGQ
jgi:steroid delta-isomerase-like uncharacterized protein